MSQDSVIAYTVKHQYDGFLAITRMRLLYLMSVLTKCMLMHAC